MNRAFGGLLACACLSIAGPVQAEAKQEFWPELAAFVQLNDRARACFDVAYSAREEFDVQSADASACLDVSLKPIARKELLTTDWQRNKYLWARVGYNRVLEATDSNGVEVAENRGVLAVYLRAPLPAAIWLETRTRADFRWIGGEYSNRYRFRLDFSRELAFRDHPLVPYFNFEWFYDTRYDDWSRTLATLGAEVTMSEHFRYEAYVARQADRLPDEKNLEALGVVLKWYF